MAEVKFVVLLMLVALTLGNPFDTPIFPKLNNRIVGGQTAEEGKFPYQVSLQIPGHGHFCGGSILNKKWILTAAFCTHFFSKAPYHFSVIVGITNLDNLESEGTEHQVSKVIQHTNYVPDLDRNTTKTFIIYNDISLIKVKDTIQFSDNVRSTHLPESNMDSHDLKVIVSGFGTLSVGGNKTKKLQYLPSKIFYHNSCVKVFAQSSDFRPIIESQICSYTTKGEGACIGDFGSPVVANNVQVGIVSQPFCGLGVPDVNTNVWSFVDWINSHINEQ